MAGSQNPNEYSSVFFVRGYVPLLRAVLNLERKWIADGRTASAAYLMREFNDFKATLLRIGQRYASLVQDAIKLEEETSRVRDDDTNGAGGPRLGDYIGESHPHLTVPGSVLINDEEVLEQNVPWWWTNEEGYSGHIGREIMGVFMPGGVPPNQADFRVHPTFRPLGKGPVGEIRNPIPERRFVLHGIESLRADWHAAVRAAESDFLTALDRVRASAASDVGRMGGGARRRPRRP